MGRRRTRDRHLPAHLYLERGTYWFRTSAKRTNLGRDYGDALREYAKLVTENWAGRTVGDVIDRYRIEVLPQKRSAATRLNQDTELNRLKRVFGGMLPDGVTAQDCYRYLDGRRDKNNEPAPVAARHEISLLGHILSKSIRWGVSSLNVVRGLDFGPRAAKRAQVTLEQVRALQALATPRLRLIIEFAILTGQRRGDLLGCKAADCIDDGILFRQGKTGSQVLIEWSEQLRTCVKQLNALTPQIPREFIVRRGDGRAYTGDGLSAIWQRLMTKFKDAGGQRFSFHDLRSVSADQAQSAEEARDRLGHADVATTKRHYLRGVTKAKPMA